MWPNNFAKKQTRAIKFLFQLIQNGTGGYCDLDEDDIIHSFIDSSIIQIQKPFMHVQKTCMKVQKTFMQVRLKTLK